MDALAVTKILPWVFLAIWLASLAVFCGGRFLMWTGAPPWLPVHLTARDSIAVFVLFLIGGLWQFPRGRINRKKLSRDGEGEKRLHID